MTAHHSAPRLQRARTSTLALVGCLALLGFGVVAPVQDARAADEDTRRVLQARQVDSEAAVSEEYARMAEEKRMESIRRLKELLNKGVEGETKAEMMLRLADLYFQQGRYLYLREMAAFDTEYDKCFNTEGCDAEKMKPDNTASAEWQTKSIKLYETILSNFPTYARADQATFYLGSALQDLGRADEAADAFKKLVKLYPQSSFVPDSYVLIGEYYFENDNAFGALKAYQKATQYTDSPKYPFAMYKLAWCYYNVGDYGKGIETMKAVVTYSMNQEQNSSGIQLQEEALKDLVRFFADAGAMNEAYEYFTKLGKKDLIRSMLQRLAGMYFEQGKFDQAVETYRRLISENPSSADNPGYQTEIIQCYRKIGQKEKTLEEIDRLLRDYGASSAWARANASNPTAVKDAEKKIEENLRRVAVDYHNEARKLEQSRHSDAAKVYDLARQAYATYLSEFKTGEHVYEVRYAFGELLYKTKDYVGAFEQYMAVVALDPNGKHSNFCAESAIFAAEEQVKLEGGAAAGGKVTVDAKSAKEPQPLTAWEQRLVDACAQFAKLYPTDKKAINAIYKSGYLLYNKYRFEEAANQFKLVIDMDPRSGNAEQAANLILDSFVVRENWQALKDNAKFYYDKEGLGSSQFKKDAYEVYERASFKVIEVDLAKDNDKGKAADRFVAFYEEFPQATTAAQALNNASIYYYETNRVDDAVKVRHILVEDPKFGDKTKYYYDQVAALGFDYESIADFSKASFYYEKLWGLYPKQKETKTKEGATDLASIDAKAGDAIYSAAVFRNGLGEWETAIANYNALTAAFPDDERVADIKIRIGRIYEERKAYDQAANVYKAFFTTPPKSATIDQQYYARLHYGQILGLQGKTKEQQKFYEETVALYEKYLAGGGQRGALTEFVAEMMFKLNEPTLEGYMAMRIKGAGAAAGRKAEDKSLTDSLGAKAKKLVEVEGLFTKVVNTGAGEWGLASLVALGKAYENMGVALRTGDTPFYLNDEQREIYKMALEDKAYVQDEKAVNAYQLALQKSYELTIYNDNTAYATRQLGVLRPNDYPGLQERVLDPRYTASKSKSYDFETSL